MLGKKRKKKWRAGVDIGQAFWLVSKTWMEEGISFQTNFGGARYYPDDRCRPDKLACRVSQLEPPVFHFLLSRAWQARETEMERQESRTGGRITRTVRKPSKGEEMEDNVHFINLSRVAMVTEAAEHATRCGQVLSVWWRDRVKGASGSSVTSWHSPLLSGSESWRGLSPCNMLDGSRVSAWFFLPTLSFFCLPHDTRRRVHLCSRLSSNNTSSLLSSV